MPLESDSLPRYPASFVQQRFWELDRESPGAPFYNHALCFRLRGIDPAIARECIGAAFERHEILRTRLGLGPDGELAQEVHSPPAVIERNQISSSNYNTISLYKLLSTEAKQIMPLDGPPAVRAALFELSPTDVVFLLTSHPFLLDNTSARLLQRELALSYAQLSSGGPIRVPRPYLQYGEFAYWQRKWFDEERRRRYAKFWSQHLRGAALSTFADWPDQTNAYTPQKISFNFGALAKCAVSDAAGELRAGPASIFLIAYCAVIHRCIADAVLAVGVLAANRGRPEIQRTLGNFANSVVVLVEPDPHAPWPQRVRTVHGELMKVLPYADLPLDVSIGESATGRPSYSIQFNYEEELAQDADAGDIAAESLDLEVGHSKFLLSLRVTGARDGLHGALVYDAAAISERVASLIVREFADSVEEITSRNCGFTAEG